MIVAGDCIRCGRKVRSLTGIKDSVQRAICTSSRLAEIEILKTISLDLDCHLERCQRPPRRAPTPEVDHVV